jgi:hypothetical protein
MTTKIGTDLGTNYEILYNLEMFDDPKLLCGVLNDLFHPGIEQLGQVAHSAILKS